MHHSIQITFSASSNKFISPHLHIKFLSMSSNIAVITQDEFEETLLPNLRMTIALPHLAPMLVAKITEKKMHQQGLWGRVAKPAPGHDFIQVQRHTPGSLKVKAHNRKITEKYNGNNKKAKTI